MLMPTSFGHPEDKCGRIVHGVSQWHVAVQRQVQLKGKGAGNPVAAEPRRLQAGAEQV